MKRPFIQTGLCCIIFAALCVFKGCSSSSHGGRPTSTRPSGVSGRNFASPMDVFNAARAAARDRDVRKVLKCHSRETQEALATHTLLAAAMMRRVSDQFSKRGDNRLVESKRKVDGVLERFGINFGRVSEKD